MYNDPRRSRLEHDEKGMLRLFQMVIPEISDSAKIVRVYNNPHFLPDLERVDLKACVFQMPETNGPGMLIYRFTIAYRAKQKFSESDLVFVLLSGPEKAVFTIEWVEEMKTR